MTTPEQVKKFLNEFKARLRTFEIIFLDKRPKNAQALADLGIVPLQRMEILEAIDVIDYSEGPLDEVAYKGSDMWVFGKDVKEKEVYIKITIGNIEGRPLCISFHPAEYKMNYPFKNNSV
ncbi:MAG: toxin [Bacteroidota bacterium]|nr:toxin [Bacteroidota bacterium]